MKYLSIVTVVAMVLLLVAVNCSKEKDNTKIPAVSTHPVTEISYSTARSGGDITNNGGGDITSKGLVWSTTENPALENHTGIGMNGNGNETFTVNLSGLSQNTVYYIRAYATNSAGTGYGNQQSFTTLPLTAPELTTGEITAITFKSAAGSGNVLSDGGLQVTARGLCWSVSQMPTVNDSKIEAGSGTGEFSGNITGLTANTNYYVRAYATNSQGTGYGSQQSFTTLIAPVPVVSTTTVSNITTTSAESGGTISDNGGSTVTARGVCWSTNPNPTIENEKTNDGSGLGAFASNIAGLTPNTNYYVRAYATNSHGTGYGQEESFTTLTWQCGDNITDLRDGNVYKTVQIGTQCWMAENLKYLPLVSPPNLGSNTSPYYYVYDYHGNDVSIAKATSNYLVYGVLYNWSASLISCPLGWNLPTDEDWKILEGTVDSQYDVGDPEWDNIEERGFDVGKNLKSTYGWMDNGNGVNLFDFNALPGGVRGNPSNFQSVSYYGSWWSTNEYSTDLAWPRHFFFDREGSVRYMYNKSVGRSLRCIRHSTK